jgi:K+/H+ antiporter YhaU regulatory subunit KhtT
MKYDCQDRGLQGLNTDCFGICGAFSGTYDTFEMDPECVKSCEALIEKRKREIYGVGSCDHQAPMKPVIWDQVPRYVPQLLKKGMSPENALQSCKNLCLNNSLPEQCQDTCLLDYNAIEQFQPEIKQPVPKATLSKKESSYAVVVIAILVLLSLSALLYFLKRK